MIPIGLDTQNDLSATTRMSAVIFYRIDLALAVSSEPIFSTRPDTACSPVCITAESPAVGLPKPIRHHSACAFVAFFAPHSYIGSLRIINHSKSYSAPFPLINWTCSTSKGSTDTLSVALLISQESLRPFPLSDSCLSFPLIFRA